MNLRPYQTAAVEAVYDHLRNRDDNPCVVCPTGCGKSLILAQIAKDVVRKWNGRVLILAHVKELLEQNAAKVRTLCPGLKIGIYSAGLKSRDTAEQVIVAGIQSVYNKACELGSFDLIIVDECFPAGTLIDTPRGQIPIEDLYVGQPVRHALGVGNVEAISSRPTFEIIKLELSNGRIIECTPNHPFFTESGWLAARTLAVGTRLFSREDVSCLRKGFPSECLVQSEREADQESGGKRLEPADMLFADLRQAVDSHEMCGAKGTDKSKCSTQNITLDSSISNRDKDMPMLRQGVYPLVSQWKTDERKRLGQKKILFNVLSSESRESYVSRENAAEGSRNIAENTPSSNCDWWQWKSNARAAISSFASTRCGNRISGFDNGATAACGSVELLQTGCGDSLPPSRNPVGRRESLCEENSQDGQADSGMVGGIRVVSITHIKLESPRVVYNLQVGGHPSFYADGVLVHNCHLIAPDGDSMYQSFLKDMKVINPNVRLIGLTATPFRLKGGPICRPENLLNHVCYEAGLKEMITQGYLSPLVSKAGRTQAELANLHIRGGEFIADEVAEAMDREELVNAACGEIVQLTRDRKSVLIFCASVEHCNHVAERIGHYSGEECAIVTGNTPAHERAEIIARFRGEEIPADFFSMKKPLKFLANVNVLTVGFDAPNTDCVVLLRPTNSAGLLVQMVGRGTRLSPETGKTNCLILDYGGNIMRHGPVDMIEVKEKSEGKGEAPAKTCPECLALIHAAYQRCPECDYEFPPPQKGKHDAHASSAGIISGQVETDEYAVCKTYYAVHSKRGAPGGAPQTMRIDYQVGFNDFRSEWVCPEHSGYAREKFLKWWRARAAPELPIPGTAHDAVLCGQLGFLAEPTQITIKVTAGDSFKRICDHVLSPVPEFGPEQKELMSHYHWEEDHAQIFDRGDDEDDSIPF